MNLVDSWLRGYAELDKGNGDHKPIVSAIDDLNWATQSRYTISRIGEWRRGVRSIPVSVRRHMLMYALPQVIADELGGVAYGATIGDPVRFQRILDKLS